MSIRRGSIGIQTSLKQASRKIVHELLDGARRYADGDLDLDGGLDFDAFCAFQPPQLRSGFDSAALRTWFESADQDGDNRLSTVEVFLWMLRNLSIKHGEPAVIQLFAKHDGDSSGR